MRERLFRYILVERVPDYEALGWVCDHRLFHTHHGHYSVIGEFLCCCGRALREPSK